LCEFSIIFRCVIMSDVEQNLHKAIEIFRGKVTKWWDMKG
jgi:hypothetical protein